MSTTYGHAEHEARHTAASWFLADGLRIDRVSVGIHAPTEGIVHSTRVGPLGIEDLIGRLVGWLGDPDLPANAVWPEPYPPRPNAPDGVGWVTQKLRLTREQYEGACQIAEELVEEPAFREAVELVARALMVAPSIDREGLEILREAAGFPAKPEPIGAA